MDTATRPTVTQNNTQLVDAYLDKLPKRDPSQTTDFILESGPYKYKMVNDWAKLPAGWTMPDVPAIAVDKNDNVVVFCRGEHPVLIFDRDGNLIKSWGEGFFVRPHGVFIGPDDYIYLADDGAHAVYKATYDGKIVMTIGRPGQPAPFMSGDPFCRCTDIALSPKGEIFVSDGYFNGRIHKFTGDGKLMKSWGGPGSLPGEFNIPHNLICDKHGMIRVADRENHRVQVFNSEGGYEGQWNNMHRANSIDQDKNNDDVFYVGEGGPAMGANKHVPNLGPSVLILNGKGERLGKIGTLPGGQGPDRFLSFHGLAVDSRGDIYAGDNAMNHWKGNHPSGELPEKLWALRKLVKLS